MEADTAFILITIVGSVLGSTLTTLGLLLSQMNRLDDKFTAKFDALGRDVSDARERLARIEGHLMAPKGFRMRGLHSSAPDEPSAEDPDPDPDQRQAS